MPNRAPRNENFGLAFREESLDNPVKRKIHMASITIPRAEERTEEIQEMTMPEAARLLSREERFMATIAAVNTLLIEKQIYTQQEFDQIFISWANAQLSKPKKQRTGWHRGFFSFLGL